MYHNLVSYNIECNCYKIKCLKYTICYKKYYVFICIKGI